MDKNALQRTIIRLSHEILEKNANSENLALVGIKRGGAIVAERIQKYVERQSGKTIPFAGIDIGMFRDDVDVSSVSIENIFDKPSFDIQGKTVILCDDVLQTGRSVRAAIDGLFASGRPCGVQLLVLIDRGGREMPVRADYVGKNFTVSRAERVEVEFEELGAKEDRAYITRLV